MLSTLDISGLKTSIRCNEATGIVNQTLEHE